MTSHSGQLPSPTIELGELLHEYALGLVLIAGVTPAVSTQPVQWVHVSELEDPTPFLTPRTVLLTTGARFTAVDTASDARAYVQRLIDAGTTALGVAVGLHLDRVPAHIVAACDRLGLPLFRVPYDTPFIAIVQSAARLLDARTRERDIWSLEAQRAVTNASLHRDGLGDAIREAARRLDRWVGVLDRSGRIIALAPTAARAALDADWVRREVAGLARRGVGAARVSNRGDTRSGGIELQTLGRRGHLLGVLVTEDRSTPDAAERTLLGLVAALATVQLERLGGIDAAQAALRSTIAHLLIAGDTALAERIAADTRVRIPAAPVVAIRYDAEPGGDLSDDLRSLDATSAGLIAATVGGAPLIIAETRHLAALRRVLQAHAIPSGVSQRGSLDELADLTDQATRARDHAAARGAGTPVDYSPELHAGVLGLLDEQPEALRRALSFLAPLREHDAKYGEAIVHSVAVWLSHHGQTSPAATDLGVHRHTLKARVQTAETLLQLSFDSPDARAEVWAALGLTGDTGPTRAAQTRPRQR